MHDNKDLNPKGCHKRKYIANFFLTSTKYSTRMCYCCCQQEKPEQLNKAFPTSKRNSSTLQGIAHRDQAAATQEKTRSKERPPGTMCFPPTLRTNHRRDLTQYLLFIRVY